MAGCCGFKSCKTICAAKSKVSAETSGSRSALARTKTPLQADSVQHAHFPACIWSTAPKDINAVTSAVLRAGNCLRNWSAPARGAGVATALIAGKVAEGMQACCELYASNPRIVDFLNLWRGLWALCPSIFFRPRWLLTSTKATLRRCARPDRACV